MTPAQESQSGLSLLELLVVLVIVGLVSTLLMQGLGFGLSLFERVHTRGEAVKQELMSRQWFRQVNASLVAKPATAGVSLEGNNFAFVSVTLNPLLGSSGIPQEIEWRIEDQILWYKESGLSLSIMSIDMDATFSYRSENGKWVNQWPSGQNHDAIPTAIAVRGREGRDLVASVRVRKRPDLLLEESRRERE